MKLKNKYYNRYKCFGKFIRFALDYLNYSMQDVTKYEYLTHREKRLISEKLFYKYFTNDETQNN